MKKAKRLLAVLLMIALVMAFAVPAMASDTGGDSSAKTSITIIPQDNKTRTYEAYQIFAGTLSTSGVLSNVEWAKTDSAVTLLATLKADTTLKDDLADCKDAAAVAEVISTWANNADMLSALTSVLENNKDLLKGPTAITTQTTEGYLTKEVDPGYYLVLETTQNAENKSKAVLKVTDEEFVTAKADGVATVTKVADGISYGIGDTIPYTVTITLKDYKEDAANYSFTLTDDFGENLEPAFTTVANPSSISSGVTIKHDGADITKYFYLEYNPTTHVMKITAHHPDYGTNDLMNIDDLTLSATSEIVVQYSARIVDTYDGKGTVVNKAQYNTSVTVPENVYPINIKVDKVNHDSEKLSGAKFKLYRVNEENIKEYAQINATSGNVTSWTTDINNAAVLTTENGTFTINGLKVGTYYLKEIEAPSGYNLPEKDFELVITSKENTNGTALEELSVAVNGGTSVNGSLTDNTVTATIENNKGATLPSTGGIGTTIFYVIGGILVVGAVVLLVTRKRMNAE